MRNPLLNALPQNRGRKVPADVVIDPVPEEYAGDNNPYRGIEAHGVEATVEPRSVPGYGEGRPAVYDAPQEEPEPIPVVVRNFAARERRRTRHYHEFAPGNTISPRRVVNADDARKRVIIQNIGVEDVWIGDTAETANALHGWRLRNLVTSPHIVYDSETQEELWASATTADTQELSVRVEYTAEL